MNVSDSTVSCNTVGGTGGGLSVHDNSKEGIYLTLNSSSINYNTAGTSGGGLSLYGGVNATLTNVNLIKNSARFGGGVYGQNSATLNIATSAISTNSVSMRHEGDGNHRYWDSVERLLNGIGLAANGRKSHPCLGEKECNLLFPPMRRRQLSC